MKSINKWEKVRKGNCASGKKRETDSFFFFFQSRFDARYWMLGAGALRDQFLKSGNKL